MAIDEKFSRLSLMWTEEQINRLQNSIVMVVGVGGVGAMAVEALARTAIGTLLPIMWIRRIIESVIFKRVGNGLTFATKHLAMGNEMKERAEMLKSWGL